jgi:hypothetical protein
MSGPTDDPERILLSIVEDYERSRRLFADKSAEDAVDMPLKEALADLETEGSFDSERERALYVTFNLTVNYRKPADRLARRVKGLWKEENWIFEPTQLVNERGYYELLNLFKGQGEFQTHPVAEEHGLMELGKTDVNYWYTVAHTLYNEHDSDPLALIAEHDDDALAVYNYVSEARSEEPAHEEIRTTKKFPGLGGEKIAPLWLRAIDDYVRPLDNIALLPLPVDRHTARLTNYLFGTNYSADDEEDRAAIRDKYRRFCEQHDVTSTRFDKALWLIGENWTDGGRAYLDKKIAEQ